MTRRTVAPLALVALGAGCATSEPVEAPVEGWALVWSQPDASEEDRERVAFSDPEAWAWTEAGELELLGRSEYAPPHRSPHSIALLPDWAVGDFVLEGEFLQTGPEYAHRDLCVFFGFEDPARFGYVHLASRPDPNAHNVFLVDGAPRRPLAAVSSQGVDWGDGVWHAVRVQRSLEEGVVRVWFGDGGAPLLEAPETALGPGRVGVGSFDDSGRFRGLRLWAPQGGATRAPGDPFR